MAAADPLPLPDSFAAIGILARHATFLLHAITGPSGAQFVARFCNGDTQMTAAVREWLRDEEQAAPDAIFAEVVALPDWRDANVVARPAFSEYEIPFLATSSKPRERQIEACDLLLGIRDGRLQLWSRTHNREVIPRVTNAHNFRTRGVSAYRFLGAMQRQRVAGALMWMWGPLAAMQHLPRVRYRNVILMRERWTFLVAEVKALGGAIAKKRGMPRFVLLDDSDQELLIDWENHVSIAAFLAIAGNAETVAVQELLPQPDAMPVHGPEGRFAHELCIPFGVRRPRLRFGSGKAEALPPHSKVRRFAPGGGEWLYWKLYTGYSTADRLLIESIAPAMRRLQQEWFFIRYSDPDHHLRLRVRGGDSGDLLRELGPLFASLLESGWLSKVQLDTYVREVERYGGIDQIARIETLFAADTQAVVAALPYATQRWQIAAWGTDRLLDDLGVDKLALLERSSRWLGEELDAGRATRDALARKTRETRAELDTIFDDATPRPWQEAYEERSRIIASLGLRIDDDIASSLVHMHLNRMFRSQKREQERVLYDLLLRRSRSAVAQATALVRS
jgi:thiopeptide-type bacteriocin biosynthesis protein